MRTPLSNRKRLIAGLATVALIGLPLVRVRR